MVCFVTLDLDFSFLDLTNTYFEETVTAIIVIFILFFMVQILNFLVKSKPRYITEHLQRQDHIEKQISLVALNIESYLNKMVLMGRQQ